MTDEFHFYISIEEYVYADSEEEALEKIKEIYPCVCDSVLESGTITNMTKRANVVQIVEKK